MPCRDSWDWLPSHIRPVFTEADQQRLIERRKGADVAIRTAVGKGGYCIKKFFDLFVSHGRPLWLLINPVATVERFANVVDADLPCVLLSCVCSAV